LSGNLGASLFVVAGLEASYPDQVWVADIAYIRLKEGLCTWRR